MFWKATNFGCGIAAIAQWPRLETGCSDDLGVTPARKPELTARPSWYLLSIEVILAKLETILKRFGAPDEVRVLEKGKFELIRLGGMTIGRAI